MHREIERYLISGLIEKKCYNDVGLLSSQHIFSDDDASYIQYQADRHYQYDQNYFLTQVKDSRLGTYEYKYDPIDRLIKAQNKNMQETYLFDPAGNLLDPDDYLEQHLKNNTLKTFLGAHYRYDEQGNVREKQTINNVLKLNWDNSNRLIASEQNGQKTKYAYDVFGRRIYKQTENEGLTLFGWDGDQMIWESYASDQPLKKTSYTKHYIYEPNSFIPVAQAGYNEFIELVELPNYAEKFKDKEYSTRQDPIWQSDLFKRKKHAESLVFYHVDQIGTPQVLTNDQGEKVWDIKLDTWGKTLEINTSNNLLEQTNIRFQGQYYDEETGLHYNRHRYYEPHSARYVSKDPIGLMGGVNNQTYVKDPNGWVDPMGLEEKKPYSGMMNANAAIRDWKEREKKQGIAKAENCGAQKCSMQIDYIVCGASYYVGSGNIGLNTHNGNIYSGIGLTKAGYDKLKGKLSLGVACLGFTLGELDSSVSRAELTDSALSGASFGVAYGSPYLVTAGVDMPVTKGGEIAVNIGGGVGTPGITLFDFSHSKIIGNTKDTEPYAKGLMYSFGR